MSRALPCGMPSSKSTTTMSASPFPAKRTAQLAPTFPDPTTVTFFLIRPPSGGRRRRLHVADDGSGEFASFQFNRAFHLAVQIIGDALLPYGFGNALLDELRNLLPAHEMEHNRAGQDDARRI